MSAAPVTVSRPTAEALVDAAARTHSPPCPPSALAELRAALTDAAEAAAWEPFRARLRQLQAHEATRMPPKGVANLNQLIAAMRTRFAAAGMSIDDPTVIRTILLTATCATDYARDLRRRALVTDDESGATVGVAVTFEMAAARLVDPEAIR